jgi:hypothetical protein
MLHCAGVLCPCHEPVLTPSRGVMPFPVPCVVLNRPPLGRRLRGADPVPGSAPSATPCLVSNQCHLGPYFNTAPVGVTAALGPGTEFFGRCSGINAVDIESCTKEVEFGFAGAHLMREYDLCDAIVAGPGRADANGTPFDTRRRDTLSSNGSRRHRLHAAEGSHSDARPTA